MSLLKSVVLLTVQAVLIELSQGIPGVKVLDLTYRFRENETIYWPGVKPFDLTVLSKGYTGKGYYYSANSFRSPEHGGTHMDAPYHVNQEKLTVDKIPVKNLFAPGVMIDISEKALGDRDAVAEVTDIVHWEEENGRIPDNAIVLINSGWEKFWPQPKSVLGTDQDDDQLNFPGLDPNAARWLVKNRKIVGVGIDTPSIDTGISTTFQSHVVLSSENIYILENVANMDKLPGAKGFTIVALPMKIYEGTGAPARIIALYGDSSTSEACLQAPPTFSYVLALSLLYIARYI